MKNFTIIAGCLLLITCMAATALSQPEPVPLLRERQLDTASYVQLARQWKEYIEKQGESADALVNLGRAYDYSGEMDAAVNAARRAFEIGPDNAKALAFYGMLMASYIGDVEGALDLLIRCRKVAPDYGYGLTNLATTYMRLGRFAESDEVFDTIFKERIIPRPLQDYAYNMLVGLPRGAVLLTYGDNDTFPPLALQAGMDFRKDIAVINMSLLNVVEYCEAMFERYPSIRPGIKIEHDHKQPLHVKLIKRMVEEQKAPVYFTASTDFDFVGFTPELYLEGFNFKTSKRQLSPEDSALLLIETYRMDSATDWNFAWSLEPNITYLIRNYVTAMINLAESGDVTDATRRRLLEKGLAIAKFHDFTRMSIHIERSLKGK